MKSIPPKGSIPPNVRARQPGQEIPAISVGSVRNSSTSLEIQRVVRKVRKPDKRTLKLLREGAEEEERKCIDILKALTPEIPEYDEVLYKLGEVQEKIQQINSQIGAKL